MVRLRFMLVILSPCGVISTSSCLQGASHVNLIGWRPFAGPYSGTTGGQQDWLEQVDPLRWVQAETNRLASVYDNDGRLDSHEKVIHERAYIDPLYRDDQLVAL